MAHCWWCTLAGVVFAGWYSTKEIGEPGDTWSWEKRWATIGRDPDRFWTGQRFGLCGKLGACSEKQAAPKGTSLKNET